MLIDGQKLSENLLNEIKKEIASLKLKKKLRLAIILVGENPASLSFIERKKKAADFLGVELKLFKFVENITTRKLRNEIKKIKTMRLNGVIIQLPLPVHINKQYILNAIPPKLDVDCLSENSIKKLYVNRFKICPAAVRGILYILTVYNIIEKIDDLKGKKVVIVGAGDLIGKPVAVLMINYGATVTVCNEFTKNLKNETLTADILISATGKPNLIDSSMIKDNAVVIDAGFSKVDGKIVGDINFQDVSKKASYIASVPGGLGPITVAMLFKNLLDLYKLSK